MATDLNAILDKVVEAIGDDTKGIMKGINDLSAAPDDAAKKKAIIGLIGGIIALVIKCIQAATVKEEA